jgi:hypothetical protein
VPKNMATPAVITNKIVAGKYEQNDRLASELVLSDWSCDIVASCI